MMMVIYRAEVIAGAPDRWAHQYERYGRETDKGVKTTLLAALKGTRFTAEQVDKIIGNETWTELKCDECEQNSEAVVRITHFDDDVSLCALCLAHAVTLLPPPPQPAE